MPRGGPIRDLTGQRFGKYTVIQHVPAPEGSKARGACWEVRCDCGTVKVTRGKNLVSGNANSCGCSLQRADSLGDSGSRNSSDLMYYRWRNMLYRCYQETHPSYSNYGGRGITVCDRWHVLDNFIADLGQPPEGLTLDRIDVDGDYEPSNVRWATYSEQNSNRRRTNRKELDAAFAERDLWRQRALDLGWVE